jgi:hypothetical protein
MISTGATIVAAAQRAGRWCLRVTVAATHGLSWPPRLRASALSGSKPSWSRTHHISRARRRRSRRRLAPLVADAVDRLHGEAPLPELVAQR